MAVKVKFFATYRTIFGIKEIDVPISGNITLRDFIILLDKHIGRKISSRILKDLKEKKNMIIFVNGKHIKSLNGLDTTIKNGDVISIFPPAGGG